ncbi:MAG: efflux RND transporter permease subunit [Syntrophus sp. (in: bacteria)]|nr:efflux RND transporter permease subunit [Syntrophus sp. (in: bacteria)]
MNLSEPFIRRPVMTLLCMMSIVLAGLIGYRLLPVSDLPAVDFPTISVSASLPGANPETMASTVATPLEKEFTTIAGLDSMISTSSQSSTRITLQFDLNRDIDAAAQDVQSAISRASRRLPEDLPTPPSFRKVNPADQPILYLALTSPTLPMYVLNEYGETQLAQQISRVTGVAQVSVYGSQKYAVRIELDPHALASRGIGIDEVSSVISHYNVNNPLGTLTGPQTLATLQSENQLMKAGLYLPLVVAYRDGQPVRLQELGNVRDSVENDRVAAWFATPTTRSRAIILAIQRQPGTNTIQVADAIKALLPAFREKLPASVSLVVLRDSSIPIKDSARDVQFTLYLTLVLVVLVIFLFLRNLSATAIPSLTLPVSLIGTFAVMYLLDYSIDNLSLMALTLSVGFVVDDAIVMLENIMRHVEMGKPRMQAALEGAREIGFTIVSMTLSLAAVFIPVLFMGGIVGRLFREFSVTIAVAVLISGFVSLSLTPMLASRFIRVPGRERHGRVYLLVEAGFDAMLSFYRRTLLWVLSRERATLIFSAALLAATVFLFYAIPKGFIPSEDRDQISIRTEAAENISFDSMVQHQLALLDIVQKDPNVDRFMCSVASGGGQVAANTGSMFIVLKPRRERELSADQVIDRLRPKLASVPGIRAFPTNPPPINIGGRVTKSLYQVTFQGIETKELFRYGAEMEDRMRRMEELQDVSSDLQLKNPEVHIDIDRDQAFILNVTPMQIENALYSAYGSRQISTIYTPNNDYQVILELLPQYRTDPSVLSMLHVRSSTGQLVPLRAITTLREDIGPLTISHSGQLPSVTISFNLKPGYSLGQAVERIQAMTAASMPSGMTYEFQGTAKAFQSSLASMGILLILAIVVIYIILGILYESFYHPVTILSALPFAGFGALLALMAFRHDLSIYAFVGIVMLVGLVKKNGIMMVDFAIEAQRKQGKNPHDAVYEACLVRFRPIMMTTMAALMAGLPIALGYGAGAESRRPLGLAVVGGLLFSQTLTLYVTPVFYVVMEKLRSRIAGGLRKQDSTTGTEP